MPFPRRIIATMKKILVLLILWSLAAGCAGAPQARQPLVVYAAGSLIIPFDDLEKAFEARYPHIDVQSEYHGSIQVIRHATELHKPIDVVVTADHALIPMLMYQTSDPDTGKPNADWYIRFATNRMALAYSDRSRYANEINDQNWTEIIRRPDVKVGISDPRFDAAGYRAFMTLQLAEHYLGQPELFEEMFARAFTFPVGVSTLGPYDIIRIPEILEIQPGANIVMRGSSIQLVALLESGDLDYAFDYESVIRQHNFRMIELPAELNLGEAEQADTYSKVAVLLDFQRFASVKPEFQGEQIGYGITIPSGAPDPEAAQLFVAFVLGEEGREIMAAEHHPQLDLPVADGYQRLPEALKPLCQPAP